MNTNTYNEIHNVNNNAMPSSIMHDIKIPVDVRSFDQFSENLLNIIALTVSIMT